MLKLLMMFGRLRGFNAGMKSMPFPARLLVSIAALPGLILVALSIVAFAVSIFALLLLTAPVYRLMLFLTGGSSPDVAGGESENDSPQAWVDEAIEQSQPQRPRRSVDVKIIEETDAADETGGPDETEEK
jgi:hypothetical protein